jgi:thiol-disulfide isomerase/thioredoxin
MDLGFGTANSKLGNATANALLQTAQVQERAVHDEMQRYDALLTDDDALAQLRSKRLQEMQREAAERQKYRAAGHGTYQELGDGSRQDTRDVAQAFFSAAKESERVVVHFYRPSTTICDVFHKHLERLAAKHLETRFVKLNVQDCDVSERGASFLVERLKITVMPTLLLVHNRQSIHQIRGFDELGGTDSFTANMLAHVLAKYGLLQRADDEIPDELLSNASNRSNLHGSTFHRTGNKGQRHRHEPDDDDEF